MKKYILKYRYEDGEPFEQTFDYPSELAETILSLINGGDEVDDESITVETVEE